MDQTFPKSRHIRRNSEFLKAYAGGKRANHGTMGLVVFVRPSLRFCRLGLSVSRKVGKAVIRNRLKRRLREIFRLNSARFKPGHDVIVVARASAAALHYGRLEEIFLGLCQKAGLLPDPGIQGGKK